MGDLSETFDMNEDELSAKLEEQCVFSEPKQNDGKQESNAVTATEPAPAQDEKAPQPKTKSMGNGVEMDLIFDPILECYFCPKTNKYYKIK